MPRPPAPAGTSSARRFIGSRFRLLLREEDAAIDEERLFGNALSSMPLTFNLFGPLALDLKLATSVFRRLLPDFVHTVEQIIFEHGPGRREDRFLKTALPSTSPSASSLPMASLPPCSSRSNIRRAWKAPPLECATATTILPAGSSLSRPDSAILRSLALEQLWREHMTAQLAVDHGITSRAIFMVIGPRLNRRVQAACRVYAAELVDADQRGTGSKSHLRP